MASWDVIIIGAGPAGLMAACRAAQRGRKTLLLEKNRKAGAKILLSGGSRCNLTHAADCRGIVEEFGPQGRFLHSALAALGPDAVIDLFHSEGVLTKVEPGGKVFPETDRAADVLAALLRRLQRTDCTPVTGESLQEVHRDDEGFRLITSRQTLWTRSVILATGGQSYPDSGSTGDGYRWSAALGHTIVTPRPALVPITTHAPWVRALQGITMPDTLVRVVEPGESGQTKVLARRRGAILFAHFGVTGPAVLDVSRAVSGHERPQTLVLQCDFLPDMKQPMLESLVQQECGEAGRRLATGILAGWLPQRVAETISDRAGLASDRRAAELTRQERQSLVLAAKQLPIPVAGTMGFRKAEVTAGGVALDEVDSHTMQSKLVPGLYFAGELLDLDGPIGGYNFQAAFSTGWLAGESVWV